MIEVRITMTGKSYSPTDNWRIFANDTKYFGNMKAAMQWIRDTYGKRKRSPIYSDSKGVIKTGYVIGFHSGDWSHAPVEKWLQQDWIEFFECKPLAI